MRQNFPATVLVALLLAACGSDRSGDEHVLQGSAMGTRFSVTIAEPLTTEQQNQLQGDVDRTIARVEDAMSTFLLESDISRFNASRSTDWIEVSASVCGAVEVSLDISELSRGAFDITVGPLVNLWGFGPATVQLAPPPADEVAAARDRVGYRRLHADCSRPALKKDRPDVYIDLSAYAKGYAVDRVADLLDERQIENYLVEIGGELCMHGTNGEREPWSIGIEKPTDAGRTVQLKLRLTDRAMATSGDYRNYFVYEGKRYSHLIDAREGRPVDHNLASVTVIADETAYADAVATAILVLGPSEGMALAVQEDIAAYFQIRTEDGFIEEMSPAFKTIEQHQ
ncbi:MAG: FAD:protein FMN transferase [Woeseiaceae bacterium]